MCNEKVLLMDSDVHTLYFDNYSGAYVVRHADDTGVTCQYLVSTRAC